MSYARQQAEAIAANVPTEVGIDPATIITILLPLFQQWLSCLWDNDDTPSERVKARVTALHEKDPKRLQRRVEKSIKRKHRDMTSAQLSALATATINHILESPDDVAAKVGDDLFAVHFAP